MKKHSVIFRLFECLECHERIEIPKKKNKMTGNGHIKTMWCIGCKKDMNFIQIGITKVL